MDPRPTTPAAVPNIEEKLRHLPAPAQAAYRRFQTERKPDDLDVVIFAILEDFVPRRPAPALATFPGDTPLMDGLGFDSLAITEIVFFVEDLFGISITNEEILKVRTLDDLRRFVRHKVSARAA